MRIKKIMEYRFQILLVLFLLLATYNIYSISQENSYEEIYLYDINKKAVKDKMESDIKVLDLNGLKYQIKTRIKMLDDNEVTLPTILVKRKDMDKARLYLLIN